MDDYKCKNAYRTGNWRFPFVAGLAVKEPLQTDWSLGTGQTGADAIEVGVGANGPTRILHTGTENGALGGRKARRGCLRMARLGRQND